jgi:hypothetical protein
MRNEDLVGVWREQGREIINADGTTKTARPRKSQIMYSPDGFMSVVSTPRQQNPVPETVARMDLDATTTAARADAAAGVTAYAGTFEVVGEDVHHNLFTALNPNRVGDTQIRHVTLAGNDLILTAPRDAEGNSFRIFWRRARSA